MCRFPPRIRPRRRDTTSTLAPAVFRARSGTTSSTFSKPSAARAAIVRPLSWRLVGMSSPCRSMAQRGGTPPGSGSLDQGAEELVIPGWLLSGERGTRTRQPDTSLGELKLDHPVAWAPGPPKIRKIDDVEDSASAAELWKVGVGELVRGAAGRREVHLPLPQLDPADLAGDRLGQLVELDLADPQEWREVLACVPQDLQRRLPGRLVARRQRDVGLRDGRAQRIGHRDDGRLGDRWVLDEHALQLEWANLVVAGLEDVVGAPDVSDVALGVAARDVAGVVVAAGHGLVVALAVALVARHQAQRG